MTFTIKQSIEIFTFEGGKDLPGGWWNVSWGMLMQREPKNDENGTVNYTILNGGLVDGKYFNLYVNNVTGPNDSPRPKPDDKVFMRCKEMAAIMQKYLDEGKVTEDTLVTTEYRGGIYSIGEPLIKDSPIVYVVPEGERLIDLWHADVSLDMNTVPIK